MWRITSRIFYIYGQFKSKFALAKVLQKPLTTSAGLWTSKLLG